ncbi:NAD-dependent epimerase/dehydratase family protein [Marivirga arenosa]|uniref:NAD-dependent epimerase/dehydratase family protein n=1 Tax=Marivirga arenosa TaxID=3059076 RepID=A0AA51N5R2_9BACT|nr:NAD-dependent epimerase/dehydratase family protein [Marivirga sp. ABR2-2]WMN06806.1 NAD-dependent epimerase/dehydratase family protein [Marivirga sp. ABR2-2]
MNYSFLKGKHILVTGGAGFIGHHLVKTIIREKPAKLYIIDNLSTGLQSNIEDIIGLPEVAFINEDVAKPSTVESITDLDYIFHLAAVVSVPKSFEMPFLTHRTNESGFINMLELARKLKVKKLCYASSSAVYGEQMQMPIQETATLNPQSPYGLSKLLNEQYAKAFQEWEDIESVGFRFFNVFGPGQRADSPYSGVISIFMDRMQKGEPIQIFGDGEQIRDFVFVDDVVQALLLGAQSEITFGLYNVGSGQTTSLNELYDVLKNLTKYSNDPTYQEARKGDIKKSAADINLIKNQLNYNPKFNLKEGLAKLIGTA